MAHYDGTKNFPDMDIETLQVLLGAPWENDADGIEGTLPREVVISPETLPGPHAVAHGQVILLPEKMRVKMAPTGNGVILEVPAAVRLAMNPESAPPPCPGSLAMSAAVFITAPLDLIPGGACNMRIVFEGLPRGNVDVKLNDTFLPASIGVAMIREYIHDRWTDGTIFHSLAVEDLDYGFFSADAVLQTFDDPQDDTCRIIVMQPTRERIKISIPVYFRMRNITAAMGAPLASPMGVPARIAVTAPLVRRGSGITAQLSTAAVELELLGGMPVSIDDTGKGFPTDLVRAGAPYDEETAHYLRNRLAALKYGFDLEALLRLHLASFGLDMVSDIGDIVIPVPGVNEIERLVGDFLHGALLNRRYYGPRAGAPKLARGPVRLSSKAGPERVPMRWRSPFIEILNGPGGPHALGIKTAAMRSMISDCFDRILHDIRRL